ncbi:LuxR C-terminal-related transcriptional regulator [Temperatibacter marinus]|uniref:LuxR C-terminal-related transcriptional regulator n=1 Tax=Temperatibacter marinus TaxID=1456591 RepID=A0AA52EIU0_9PROT|nr:LuxR C-terminal-related transcriptional regulator [Temperatibacter marinus]WND03595.1 LuxR C-terminal-related transcriptional regulator [Temperatibacter marinus]
MSELISLFHKNPEIGEYVCSIADVVRSMGGEAFEKCLMNFLSEVVPVDHCVVFTYSDRGNAGHLFTHSRMPDREAEELARDYVDKFYKDDPNFKEIQNSDSDEYIELDKKVISVDYDPAYQNHFFDRRGLIDKAASVGKVEDGRVYCNFYRMVDSVKYSNVEWSVLKDLMPLATALIAVHYDIARANGNAFPDNGSENIVRKSIVHNVISKDSPPFDSLTMRERQVCERILLGYTTIGIGFDLGIAPTSVATYRKRSYAKLNISSQNELFNMCLKVARAH